MTDKKHIPEQHSFETLLNDSKNNGKTTQEFKKSVESTYLFIAREFAENLHYYFEYAEIFVDDHQAALDLVQYAFAKSLENPEDFEGKLETSPQTIILSHIQEELEQQQNELYAATQSIIDNEVSPHTEGEIEHLRAIQLELAKALSDLPPEDAIIIVKYMESNGEVDLPKSLKDKLFGIKALRDLHFNNKPEQKPEQ
ncbi:MAG: hypothetical protein COA45_02135 [Zetaproteobacteria bacterium]|nr:MAG: hypothetical protein COA45_02135 [Zetaproteobacteria bacterium]